MSFHRHVEAQDYLSLKGGYLDFSHLTEIIYIYIYIHTTEIYMKIQYKSSITNNHRIKKKKKKKKKFDGVPLKGYVAS